MKQLQEKMDINKPGDFLVFFVVRMLYQHANYIVLSGEYKGILFNSLQFVSWALQGALNIFIC